jgi:hypothetical protein
MLCLVQVPKLTMNVLAMGVDWELELAVDNSRKARLVEACMKGELEVVRSILGHDNELVHFSQNRQTTLLVSHPGRGAKHDRFAEYSHLRVRERWKNNLACDSS